VEDVSKVEAWTIDVYLEEAIVVATELRGVAVVLKVDEILARMLSWL
jgi:hypothetical protein